MKIPPLNPLRVFEVVARLGNLTHAAEELHVSQSAVSRQVAVLEEYLGLQLFQRERAGVRLTEVGEAYARRIAPAFQAIASATSQVTSQYADQRIRLRTYTTLTARWLIPRLPAFKARHPDIEVAVDNRTTPLNFSAENCDMAVVLGDGHWHDADATLLLEDIIEPVCAPALLAEGHSHARFPDYLLGKRRLVAKYRKSDWATWLRAVERADLLDGADTMTFSSSALTWQAAVDGLGIAMGQKYMLDTDLQQGRLLQPFGRPVATGKGHYLVTPTLQRFSGKIAAFRDWLLEEAAQTRRDGAG